MPISPKQTRSRSFVTHHTRRDAAAERGFVVHRQLLREVAGRIFEVEQDDVELGAGDAGELVDGGAAAGKFATICTVTSTGGRHALRGRRLPAKTKTTRSSFGMSRPCQRASHAAIASSRPKLPCGGQRPGGGRQLAAASLPAEDRGGRAPRFIKRFEWHGANLEGVGMKRSDERIAISAPAAARRPCRRSGRRSG
jgi:hypothetical protein